MPSPDTKKTQTRSPKKNGKSKSTKKVYKARPIGITSRIRAAFDREALKRVCEMSEEEFAGYYGMDTVEVMQRAPDNEYYFKDNGSNILAVAHLDTVMPHEERTANFVESADGLVIFSGALDDRLGAYIILELLPALGIQFDILLTVGEECGQSTAAYFDAPKEYLWGIEFDRGGTDVVLYEYEDDDFRDLVRASGARVGVGAFSDISYMEHLEIKMANWGVGYADYHGPRSHAFLEDTFKMVGYFLNFHDDNADIYLPHEQTHSFWGKSRGKSFGSLWGDDDYYAKDDDEIVSCEYCHRWLYTDEGDNVWFNSEGDDVCTNGNPHEPDYEDGRQLPPGLMRDIVEAQIVDDHYDIIDNAIATYKAEQDAQVNSVGLTQEDAKAVLAAEYPRLAEQLGIGVPDDIIDGDPLTGLVKVEAEIDAMLAKEESEAEAEREYQENNRRLV